MQYKKISGAHNGKNYDVEVAIEEAYAYTGLVQCGWHVASVIIDGKQYKPSSKHLDIEELHEFVSLNIES